MPKILEANRWPQQRPTIGRMRDRAVDETPQADFTKNRHAFDRAFQPRGDPLQILGKQLAGRLPFGLPATRGPCFGQPHILIYANQPAFLLLPKVSRNMGATHYWNFFFAILESGNGIGDDIMMLHIGHRNVDARHLRDSAGITASGIHNDFGADSPLVGDHLPFATGELREAGDQCLARNLCPHVFRANGQRIADARRVGMAVLRRPRARNHAVKCHKRIVFENFLRRYNLHIEADNLRKTKDIAHPRQLALISRKADATRFMPTDILSSQPLQLRIELVRIGMHLGEVEAAGDVGALPGGMPC